MSRLSRSTLAFTAVALMAAAALAGQTIRVAYIPIIECAPLYVAQERGLFKGAGLDVELTPMKGGAQILPAVASGSLEIGFTNVVSLISFDSQLPKGHDEWLVSLVGATYERKGFVNHALVERPGQPVPPADIAAGKARVAVNTARNIEELMLRRYLEKLGFKEPKLNLVPIAFPEMLSSLARKEVDVASIVEPFIQPAKHKVGRITSHYLAVESDTLVATYAAKSSWVRKNSETAMKFRAAIDAATDLINKDPRATRSLLSNYAHVAVEDLDLIGMPAFEKRVTPAGLRAHMGAMLRWGFIKLAPDADSLLLK